MTEGEVGATGICLHRYDQRVRASLPVHQFHPRRRLGVSSRATRRMLLDPLVARLKRRWPRWKQTDVLYDPAVDVVLGYLQVPERYDPSSGLRGLPALRSRWSTRPGHR